MCIHWRLNMYTDINKSKNYAGKHDQVVIQVILMSNKIFDCPLIAGTNLAKKEVRVTPTRLNREFPRIADYRYGYV